MPAKKNDTAKTDLRVNLHVLIDLDSSKWEVAGTAGAPDEAAIAAALIAGGIAEDQAAALAARAAAKPAGGSGTAAVRDGVREYVLGELRKLERLVSAGAKVAYYQRPARQ